MSKNSYELGVSLLKELAKKDINSSNVIDFIISYYQEWTNQYIHLYINGEYERIRWPNSGNNPKIIEIKHVSPPVNSQTEE